MNKAYIALIHQRSWLRLRKHTRYSPSEYCLDVNLLGGTHDVPLEDYVVTNSWCNFIEFIPVLLRVTEKRFDRLTFPVFSTSLVSLEFLEWLLF